MKAEKLIADLLVAGIVGYFAGQARRQRDEAPRTVIALCETCERAPAKERCKVHRRLMCGRCGCVECKAIKARIKAGKPRVPTAHNPATCNCPWCCKFDGDQTAGEV